VKAKLRLDQLLVQRGLAETREKAKAMIMAGLAEVDGVRRNKPGHTFPATASVRLIEPYPPFVSRGGVKLEAALQHFPVDVRAKTILDVGSSTGGFTDCLLQYGARKVISVDVGYGQIDDKLRKDPRVHLLERTNIRYLESKDLPERIDGATIDVSFISLRLVVPPVSRLLTSRAFIIALIKPQFEVAKERVGKGGVVRDPAEHARVVEELVRFFSGAGWSVESSLASPLKGPKGNREFLVYLRR